MSKRRKSFENMINSLGIPNVYINNLYEESKTGIILCKVLDKVS